MQNDSESVYLLSCGSLVLFNHATAMEADESVMYVQIFLVRFAAISTQFESIVVAEAEISRWFGCHKSAAFV